MKTHQLYGKRSPSFNPFFGKSKAANGSRTRARMMTRPARRNTSGPRLYERDSLTDCQREMNRTNERRRCRRNDRVASTWTSTWTCVPCKNDDISPPSQRRYKGIEGRSCASRHAGASLSLLARSLAPRIR